MFFEDATHGGQLIIASVCAGVLCAGALALASIPIAAMAFTIPVFAGIGTKLVLDDDPTSDLAAVLVIVYAVIITRGVFSHGLHLVSRTVAQIETEKRSRTDALTGVPNRVEFQERLEAACDTGDQLAVLCLDLDSFKSVNDSLGHAAGDALLQEAAARLRHSVHSDFLVARLSGDEFAIVAPGADRPCAVSIAESVVGAFHLPFCIEGIETIATASLGVALAPEDGTESRRLLKCADAALYRAKHSRSGSFEIFEPGFEQHARERRVIEQQLRTALHRREFRLMFQPFLNLAENRIVGCEALVRWQHPERGLIGPSEFIAVAEETGLIQAIGDWVLSEACRIAARWPSNTRVAVNLSPVQLHKPAILSSVRKALAETGLHAKQLELEVTETALISDENTTIAVLKALSKTGVQIALDDFGTGYSSLSYLQRLPLDRIKIDRSFVAGLQDDKGSHSIVKAVLSLAADLEIGTTAEGVETPGQLAALQALDCSEVQGFWIGKPMNAGDAAGLFALSKRAA